MIFVTGGCFPGKTANGFKIVRCSHSGIADGAVCSMEEIKKQKVLDHFHLLVQRWMQAGKIPADEIEFLSEAESDVMIITDEIGSGIVPLDVKEREWREVHGGICCQLAKEGPMLFSRHRRHHWQKIRIEVSRKSG